MRALLAVLFTTMMSFAGTAGAQPAELAQQIDQALSTLQPATQVSGRSYPAQSLAELLRLRNIPGASIAVFRDGRIIYARGFGVAEAGGSRAVDTETLFQAASISKPLTATAALALVEQGRIDLDGPVNERLTSWRIPDSAAAEGVPVTLRQLLTHTAGLTVHGFPGYAPGAPLPAVAQVLDGAPPANTPAVRVDQRPGSAWRYSGGGFTVSQLLLSDVTGEPFADLMRRLVLAPAGMAHSTYAQPPPVELRETAAWGYRGTGEPVEGGYHVYPEQAAAGLWTTPSDLARWALALSADFTRGDGKLLDHDTAIAMLTPGLGGFGLGVGVGGSGDLLTLSHGGANEGYRAVLRAFPRKGDGIAIMTNSDNGDALMRPVMIAVGRALGWPGSEPQVIVPVAVPAQQLADAVGRYATFGVSVDVQLNGDVLRATATGRPPGDLIPQGDDRYLAEDGTPIRFVRDPATNGITGLAAAGVTLQRSDP
ncbi:MAG TPA: serine hydrolase domain-containing protein [Croceibacterium sp.]